MPKRNLAVLEAIYDYVRKNPGATKSQAMRSVGLGSHTSSGRLATMERVGLFLCEDIHGRLFPYSRYGVLSKWWSWNRDKG